MLKTVIELTADGTEGTSLLMLALAPFPSRFGGGPAVNHLYVCSVCQVEIEALAKRRRVEIDTFIKVRVGNGDLGTSCSRASRGIGCSEVQSALLVPWVSVSS